MIFPLSMLQKDIENESTLFSGFILDNTVAAPRLRLNRYDARIHFLQKIIIARKQKKIYGTDAYQLKVNYWSNITLCYVTFDTRRCIYILTRIYVIHRESFDCIIHFVGDAGLVCGDKKGVASRRERNKEKRSMNGRTSDGTSGCCAHTMMVR